MPTVSNAQTKKKKPTSKKTTTTQTVEDTWKEIGSDEGDFSVSFPAKHQKLQQDFMQACGKITGYTYIVSQDSGNIAFGVYSQSPYPPFNSNCPQLLPNIKNYSC
jgi:hypothetical protein